MAGSLASGSLAAPTLGQLSSQARALANQSVAAQIAAVRSQQQQDLAQAQQRANSINAAALAASRYLQSLDLGGKAKADYQTAVGNQTGIASGYSGQLRSDADAAAKAAQASLASVPGNAQTVTDKGPSLANVLYGLGGALPATQLNTVEPAAVQAARALTASPLGYGQQEAYGALGAGAQAAQGLAGQIANARAQEPTLTQSYLAQLSQAVRDQALANSLIAQRGAPKVTTSGGGVYTVDPSTGKVTTAVSPPAPKPHIVSTGGGIYSVDPSTGATTTLKAPPPKSGATNASRGGLTANEWLTLKGSAAKRVAGLKGGTHAHTVYVNPSNMTAEQKKAHPDGWLPEPNTGTAPTSYQDALAQVTAMGPNTPTWQRQAVALVQSQYAEGELGRPWSAASARQVAAQTAALGYKRGVPYATALAGLITHGIPRKTATAALRKAYYGQRFSPVPGTPHYQPQAG